MNRGGKAHIGRQSGSETPADTVTLDQCHQRFVQTLEPAVTAFRDTGVFRSLYDVCAVFLELRDVGPGNKRLTPRTTHHHHSYCIVALKVLEDIAQGLRHLEIDGVAFFRLVEGDPTDTVFYVGQHFFRVELKLHVVRSFFQPLE